MYKITWSDVIKEPCDIPRDASFKVSQPTTTRCASAYVSGSIVGSPLLWGPISQMFTVNFYKKMFDAVLTKFKMENDLL